MNFKAGIGLPGVMIAALLALAMCVASYIIKPVELLPIQYGICLNSPDSWHLPPFVSWLLNIFLIGSISLILYLVNKTYNFVRTTEPVLTVVFIVMATSSPWFTQGLNTSTLLALANVICLGIIYGAYEAGNATRQLFIVGVVAGFGSMFQYAFLPMGAVYLLWALWMKVLRIKELLAFLIGLLCPYWILLGLGVVHFRQFHLPSLVPFFDTSNDHSDILFLIVGIALAAIIGILTGLVTGMKIFAGNSRINAMNMCVTVLGIGSLACILVDYENIPAYVLTLYLCTTVQIANICSVWHIRYPWTISAIPSSIYILLFIGNILL